MKSDLLKYWRETIPLLTESGYMVPLEFLIEKIFLTAPIGAVFFRAQNRQILGNGNEFFYAVLFGS